MKESYELFNRESNRKAKLLRMPTVQEKVEQSKEQMFHSVIIESSKYPSPTLFITLEPGVE